MTTLADEARYLHDCFFSQPLDQAVVERYVAAHDLCIPRLDEAQARTIDRIVSAGLDAEAIELVFRRRQPDNFLTKKIQILFYLVEVRSSYYEYFVNQEAGFRVALRRLVQSALGAAGKYLKGTYLIWRHSLV
jgi:hypothetical protein